MSGKSRMRVIACGGGVQSSALVILAATRNREFEAAMGGRVHHALFANTGDDSELPETLTFLRETLIPWAFEREVELHELAPLKRSIWAHIIDHDDPTTLREPIPVFGTNGAPMSRSCTADWKIKRMGRWLKDQGCGIDKPPATVAIGISVDEIERAGRGRDEKWERRVYPLLDLGMTRSDCEQVIRDADMTVPPKSSCFFCPFHSRQVWAEMRRDKPDLFAKAEHLESVMNARREKREMTPVYLTRYGKPLRDAVSEAQTPLFTDGAFNEGRCDEGYCWT